MRPKSRAPLTRQSQPAAARGEGIEHAHFDVGVRGQSGEASVLGACIHVVHQQAHVHATIGGRQQALRQEQPGGVGVPDIGLHVETAFGQLRALRFAARKLPRLQPPGGIRIGPDDPSLARRTRGLVVRPRQVRMRSRLAVPDGQASVRNHPPVPEARRR